MATKRTKATRKRKPALPKVSPQEEYLLTLIRFSEAAIGTTVNSVDEFFKQQAERLRLQLEQLRAST